MGHMQSAEEVVGHRGPACLEGKRNLTEDHFFFLRTPDCTARAHGKGRKFAMSLQRFFAQIKWDGEEAINFQFKS